MTTTNHKTTLGINFTITTNENLITFLDQNGGFLSWTNTLQNIALVDNMVHTLETVNID